MPNTGKHAPRWALSRGVSAAALLAGALVIGGAVMSLRELRETIANGDASRRSLGLMNQIERLRTTLVDAETGQRGYLLTGDARYLDPYQAARAHLSERLDGIEEVARDGHLASQMQGLRADVTAKMVELDETIALRRQGASTAALALVLSNKGQQTMDAIRIRLDALSTAERAEFEERIATRARHAERAVAAMAFVASGAVLLLGGVLVSLNRWARDRREAIRQSTESAERLRVTLQSIGDGVIATDTAGSVVFMNPVAEALTGWRHTSALGLPVDQIFRIVNEQTRDVVESPISKVIRDGVLVGLANHTILLARDGSERPIDDSGAPIRDGDGELMGVVLVFRDVSARRLSEDARERMLRAELQAAAAEEANRAKDEFLAIVSHELRSPLHAAVGWLEVLKRGALDETLRSRALHRIGESLRRQATLTNDLLDVSRIVSGKLTIERTAFDLAELLENVVDDKRPRAAEALVRLSLVRTDDAVIVVGDSDRLSQVFSNLLSNAIQFTDGGGVVTVTLDSTPDLAVVTVADTGKGIAPEFLPHVFDRFRQAESGASRSHRGLGLGLAISKHIVERHGGSIVAESAGRGRGATFRVRLSLEESIPGSGAVRAASAPSPALAGLHVLVVMDDPDVPEAMFQRIRAEGATVEQVRGVGAALARCDAEPPDVILADLALPDDDGYTFLREIRLRDKEARRRTTVFALTTLVENVDRGQAADQGFDGFAVRPVELDRLVADVAAARLRIEASGRA